MLVFGTDVPMSTGLSVQLLNIQLQLSGCVLMHKEAEDQIKRQIRLLKFFVQ